MNAALTVVTGFEIKVVFAAGRNSLVAHCLPTFCVAGGFALMIALPTSNGNGADCNRVSGRDQKRRNDSFKVFGVGVTGALSLVLLCRIASARHCGCQFAVVVIV